ncbi:methyl-accepting chemotaxis protein [Parasalinivibrio latis]|uniref:methyl-accepting chemotaxis protein n=1 Tax=Parasalinivibrio latis TaxID=2952610 RepID=UPI0030DE39BB
MKVKQRSVVRQMYAGFSVLILAFVASNLLTLDGAGSIHHQLERVTGESVPLVTLSNEVSVSLLEADKVFKDYLATDNSGGTVDVEERFAAAKEAFDSAFQALSVFADSYPQLKNQLTSLQVQEDVYFSEAAQAIRNVEKLHHAEAELQQYVRRYQALFTELNTGMKEMINSQGNTTAKVLSKSYFVKLADAERITSDALATRDLTEIEKAVSGNNKSVTHLNYAYRGITNQMPALKERFDPLVSQFITDVGKKGGVLDKHQEFVLASSALNTNITNLSLQVDHTMATLAEFRELAQQQMNAAIHQASEEYRQGIYRTLLLGAAVTALVIFIGWHLSRSVRRPTSYMMSSLESLASGNMTKRIEIIQHDEFGELSGHINTLADQLQGVLRKIQDGAEQQAQIAEENQAATQSAKEKLNLQRNQTTTVAAAMTEMDHSAEAVFSSAQSTLQHVHDVSDSAARGRDVMSRNISTSHELSNRLNESEEAVRSLKDMSLNIGSILDVIRNIADQTNLLALNAAIEAARAGEQGRGFAVVADEVRVLAKRTTDSTAEIESMIARLQESSTSAMSVMQDCVQEMEASIILASDANSAMEEIEAAILLISDMSSQIAQAADEQRKVSMEISKNIEDISHLTEESYQSMEEVANTGHVIDEQAHIQNDLVHRFTL